MSRKRPSDCLQANEESQIGNNSKGNMLEASVIPSSYLETKFDYFVHIFTKCFIYNICKLILLKRFNIPIQMTKEGIGQDCPLIYN